MTAIERDRRAAHIENLRAELGQLNQAWLRTVQINPDRNDSATVWDDQGRPLAKILYSQDAYFLTHAARTVVDLLDTLEEVQEELREARTVRRSYAVLTNHLLQAQRAGFSSREGQKRIKDAHAEALDPTENKEWDW